MNHTPIWRCTACGHERPVVIDWLSPVHCEQRVKRGRRWARCGARMEKARSDA